MGRDPEAPHFGRRELRVLWPHLRPYTWPMAAAVALLLVSQLASLAGPVLLQRGIDLGIRAHDLRVLNVVAVLFCVSAAVNTWALRAATLLSGRVGERALQRLRVVVFSHLTRLDLGFFEREQTGRLVARLTSDVETIELLVTEALVQFFGSAIYLVGSAAVLFALDAELAAISLGTVLPATTVAVLVFRVRSERAYNRVRERIAAVLSLMQETVRGVQVVQAFGRERYNARRFRQVNADWREANVESFRLGSRFFPAVELIGILGSAIVLGYGGWETIHGELSVGRLAAFVVYLGSTLEPIQVLSQFYDTFQSAMAGLARLAAILEQRPRVTEAPGATPLDAARGRAALEEVTFRYRDEGPDALAGVSLAVGPGETLALVGPTGAGKSTIAKLLLRFYDPTTGRVTLDGRDLRSVSLASLRRTTALVPQEGFLFRGTIRDNVRFGRPEASDAEVEAVCRLLELDQVAARLPEGYDTEVRERGAALSGGERQLVALARALLADPRLLVLDEATSALDARTEAHVESALRLAAAGRTTVVIAHRLSTASRAGRIAVVDGGRIVEVGSHAELVAAGGLYARLYRHWLASR